MPLRQHFDISIFLAIKGSNQWQQGVEDKAGGLMMGGRVERIKLGSQGLEVSAQGLGCMGMSTCYGPPKPEEDMISLIHHAIHSGVTFLDSSDVATNEILLGKVLIKMLYVFLTRQQCIMHYSVCVGGWYRL